MLTISYFKQDNEYFCGPASLQMAFSFFGKTANQIELAAAARTTMEQGTDNKMLVKVAEAAGFNVKVKEPANLEDITNYLNQSLPVIVNFIEPQDEEGHFAVVVDMNDTHIILNDPWNGADFKMPKQDFLNRWHSRSQKHTHWLMALTALNSEQP